MNGYVLVVDDDPDARQILSFALKRVQIPTQIAADGVEALKLLTADPPKLILLDLMMPRMNGFTLLSRLQSNAATRHIPVIVVSAVSSDQRDILRLPGVRRVVRKAQFTIPQFIDTVHEVLGLSPTHSIV